MDVTAANVTPTSEVLISSQVKVVLRKRIALISILVSLVQQIKKNHVFLACIGSMARESLNCLF